ncbi:hypothetical protein [Cupriavidus sp. BIC8F]|uniref:hypothetical protein n=1 Tax=Cupriavidus sp. BIC8F TaxID=3079014 RepID=UPI002915E0D1|nr:hypothetical protein [Cupriavidus sp. BIC8F]
MGKITKEQITAIEYELASPWGRLELACDGFKVNVEVQPEGPRKYVLMVYVNGAFKGTWMKGDCEEATRFMRPVTKSLYGTKVKSGLIKDLGKRRGEKLFAEMNKTLTHYTPVWNSVRSMLSHFCKKNEAVSIVSIGYHAKATAEAA